MAFELAAVSLLQDGIKFEPRPFIRGWSRLEGRVRTEDFSRALRAEARDPMWFLTRQWQFLELRGDDAGSPIEARAALRRTPLERFASRENPSVPFPKAQPLEAVVEREAAPIDQVALIQLHRALDKVLVRQGASGADRQAIHAGMRTAYPLDPATLDGVDDGEAAQLLDLVGDRLFDARALLDDPNPAATITAALGPLAASAVAAAASAVAWWRDLYFEPDVAGDEAWATAQLEYQFSCGTAPGAGQTVLVGDSYAQGRLDWFSVDVAEPGTSLGEGGDGQALPIEETLSFLPTAISFGGMPAHRFWEMEDRRVDFGSLAAHTTDVAKLLLMEFVLAYADDWCLFPYEMEVGALCELTGLVVHDVFGDATLVRAADRGSDEDWRRWAMFGLETRAVGDLAEPRIFVPPTTPKLMEGPALERVLLIRDEMANLCWGIERVLPSTAGMGVDGALYAADKAGAPPPDTPVDPEATARYHLGTDAPLNWLPFIPVHVPGSRRSVRLQRGRLPLDDRGPEGAVLTGPGRSPTPYFLNEEEIPRAGKIVTRGFQRCRWTDGRIVLWLGRRVLTGRGEGSSGLAFDVVEEVPSRL